MGRVAGKINVRVKEVTFDGWTHVVESRRRYPSGQLKRVIRFRCNGCGGDVEVVHPFKQPRCWNCQPGLVGRVSIGQRSGTSTVSGYIDRPGHEGVRWLFVVCDQGHERPQAPYEFLKGRQCRECVRRAVGSRSPRWRGVGELSQSYVSTIRKGAESRGLVVTVTIDELWALYQKQDGKCALSGVRIGFARAANHRSDQTASLDRIDSSLGYTTANVQWVHKIVNLMKMDIGNQDFIEWCRAVANHASEQPQQHLALAPREKRLKRHPVAS